jgi:dihydroorotate dehydrogenase electron transfer subunit
MEGSLKELTSTVISNRQIASNTYLLTLECEMDPYDPGQFVMVKAPSPGAFLRRPLGIMELKDGVLALLYKTRGEGTIALSMLKEGETISVMGPLGKGFSIDDEAQVVYVAGGIGLPPLLSLYNKLKRGKFLIGAKSEEDIPFDYMPAKAEISTEDGSVGYKGLVTELLSGMSLKKPCMVYACGPMAMLRETADISRNKDIPCQVSMEERMACGFGVCAGCVVRTTSGNKSVCALGPVFNAGEIIW